MNRIISFYNQNRRIIWITVIAIIIVIAVIHALNNIVINNKAIKESTEPAKRYLLNISKTAMHSMYKGIFIASEVEGLNAQLSNQNYSIKINNMLNKIDEDLIKNLNNKIKMFEVK